MTTATKTRAPRQSAAAKKAAAMANDKKATSTEIVVIPAEDVVLEGVLVDDVPTTTVKKARIDHSTHAHASSKAGRAKCRADLKAAAAKAAETK